MATLPVCVLALLVAMPTATAVTTNLASRGLTSTDLVNNPSLTATTIDLYLNHNDIEAIPDGVFANMDAVNRIRLYHNALTNAGITENSFSGVGDTLLYVSIVCVCVCVCVCG